MEVGSNPTNISIIEQLNFTFFAPCNFFFVNFYKNHFSLPCNFFSMLFFSSRENYSKSVHIQKKNERRGGRNEIRFVLTMYLH